MNINFKNVSDLGFDWHLHWKNLERKQEQYKVDNRKPGKANSLSYMLSHERLEYDHHFELYQTKNGTWVLIEERIKKNETSKS